MSNILFFSDEVDFSLENEEGVKNWLFQIAESEKTALSDVNIIFTSDENLLKINKDFLKHDFYTDIITFQNKEGIVDGEIYISIDRVFENAKDNKVESLAELYRVMAHGILHMTGYGDKTDEEKALMRSREDFYLNLLPV